MHRDFTDDDLAAFLDGALDADRRSDIEAALAADAALGARLASMRRLNAAVREVAGNVEPVPERFSRLVNDGFDRRETAVLIDLRSRARDRMHKLATPIAASLALFVAAAGGYWAGGAGAPLEDASQLAMIAPGSAIFEALETTPSGQSRELDGQTLTPVLSFVAADGRSCREIETASAAEQSVAIVCRESNAWRVEVMVASAGANGSGYETVGDAGVIVEEIYNRLGAGAALSADDESARIQRGWGE